MMLAMIVKLVHAIALVILFLVVCCDGQKLIEVMVGREGDDLKLRFSPEEVFADVGDRVQFQFYPLNHSAVQADFENPCIPIKNTTGVGFFSGFRPLPLNTEILTTFTINVTRPDPIFFYCSQGRHCQQGFVGVINPTVEKSLAKFKAAAEKAPESLSPGEVSSLRATPSPTTRAGLDFTDADNDKTITNVGAIVGGVLGGVALFVILVTFGVYLVTRRRNGNNGNDRPNVKVKYTISKPELQKYDSNYGSVSV